MCGAVTARLAQLVQSSYRADTLSWLRGVNLEPVVPVLLLTAELREAHVQAWETLPCLNAAAVNRAVCCCC